MLKCGVIMCLAQQDTTYVGHHYRQTNKNTIKHEPSNKQNLSFSPISFMYIRNMRGPNTDPWGTPAETGSKLDQE
jgi:hypothetical protein